MKKRITLAASLLALVIAAPALAQGALVGVDDLDERIDDIQEDVSDDLTNADARYRQNQYAQGWVGSVALGFSATSGNTDTADLDLAGRFRYGNGRGTTPSALPRNSPKTTTSATTKKSMRPMM